MKKIQLVRAIKLKRKFTASIVFVMMILFLVVKASATVESSSTNQEIFSENKVELTDEEEEYLKEHPVIVVAADASWRPLEYVEDNQYTGVIANILERLEEYTGFEIEYQILDSYAEALNVVRLGEADLSSGLAWDKDMAREYNVNLSDPYLTINSSVVSKKEITQLYDDKEFKKIAVVEGDYANTEIEKKIANSELIECGSNEECLNKVKNNEVDMAIIASYCAEYYMSVPKYSELKSHTISDFSWQLSFGISRENDPFMVRILNKGIAKISQVDLNEAIYEGIIHAAYDNDLLVFIYKHPILVISLVLGVVLVVGILVSIIFLSKKKEHMRQLEDGTRLKLALERTKLCIWEIDIASRKVEKIDNEQEKHGFYELRENIPESVIENGYIHPEDVTLVRETIERVVKGEQDVQGCWRIREKSTNSKDSTYWWEQVLFQIVYDERKKPVKAIGVSEDVTKEKDAQKDSLTSVYNRNSFEQKASSVLNERRNSYLQYAFLILDLDGFKKINDTYGHGMGDRVLISVGAALKKTFRSTDFVGRLGGDEFTVFMTSISKVEDAARKAQELVENISGLGEKEGYPFPISCSVGVVVGTKGKEDFETLYKRADTVLYEAKRAGKNQFKLYEN